MNLKEITAFNSLIEACITVASSDKFSNAWRAANACNALQLAELVDEFNGEDSQIVACQYNIGRCQALKEIFVKHEAKHGKKLFETP